MEEATIYLSMYISIQYSCVLLDFVKGAILTSSFNHATQNPWQADYSVLGWAPFHRTSWAH